MDFNLKLVFEKNFSWSFVFFTFYFFGLVDVLKSTMQMILIQLLRNLRKQLPPTSVKGTSPLDFDVRKIYGKSTDSLQVYHIDVKYNESAEFKSGMQKLGQIMTKYLIT